jgi:hypothetical protein
MLLVATALQDGRRFCPSRWLILDANLFFSPFDFSQNFIGSKFQSV